MKIVLRVEYVSRKDLVKLLLKKVLIGSFFIHWVYILNTLFIANSFIFMRGFKDIYTVQYPQQETLIPPQCQSHDKLVMGFPSESCSTEGSFRSMITNHNANGDAAVCAASLGVCVRNKPVCVLLS